MNIRYFLFLAIGVAPMYSPPTPAPPDAPRNKKKVSEPDGSRICRRNILALSSILVVAGFAGLDPHNGLKVFDLQFSGERGVWALGAAAIVTQIYWFVMRYHHLAEDGTVPGSGYDLSTRGLLTDKLSENACLVRKGADLRANWVAIGLTAASWYFIASWICDGRAA